MKNSIRLLVALVLLIAGQALAEEIELKDGSKITGKIVAVNGETFRVKTNYGEINVPRSDVMSIAFPENTPKNASGGSESLPKVDEDLKEGTYTNRTAGFRINVPNRWKIASARPNKDVVAALHSPDETLFFMVTAETFAGTLATYKVLAETQYQKAFSEYVDESDGETQLDGQKAIRTVWHGTSNANQAKLKFLVYIISYEGRMVRLSFFTLPPLFNDAVPTFEKIAASYRSSISAN